jgi:N-acyl-D-amino-acid deacylase
MELFERCVESMFDIKIINGRIIDGSGKSAYTGDIGIVGDRIVAIGDLRESESNATIDAKGNVVAPGFIDMHTHSDLSVVYDRNANSKIHSGVTTEVMATVALDRRRSVRRTGVS